MQPSKRTGRQPLRITQIVRGTLNTKQEGEIAELAFVHKVASLGFGVAKPYGDSERYDYVLDSGERFWRVQVKSTASYFGNGYRTTTWRTGGKPYKNDEIDFLVACITPLDIWYVIPVRKLVPHRVLTLYPLRCGEKGGAYEVYREAWYLMAPGASPNSDPCPVTLPLVRAICPSRTPGHQR
jgi:hypothetical protein